MSSGHELQAKRREAILEILAGGRALHRSGEIPDWMEEEEESSPFRKVVPFIRRVRQAGPYQLFIVTTPGAGRVVAQAVEESGWENIVGILEGNSGVLILKRLVYSRLRHYLGSEEGYEIWRWDEGAQSSAGTARIRSQFASTLRCRAQVPGLAWKE